jgi:conjugal transfer pilus assembly protein TraV
MFHENVKGGFLCQAPKGLCAPSTSIDDAALEQIGGQRGDGDMVPASDMAMAGQAPGRSPKHARQADAELAIAESGRPALRVVHPAWRDGQGRLHARTTDYAYVDASPVQGFDAPAVDYGADRGDGADRSLLDVAERAPQVGGITMAKSPALSPMAAGMPSAGPAAGVMPSAALEANPTDAIRAKVSAILARAPKPMVTTTPAASAPFASSEAGSTSQSGGTFPPAGS